MQRRKQPLRVGDVVQFHDARGPVMILGAAVGLYDRPIMLSSLGKFHYLTHNDTLDTPPYWMIDVARTCDR